MAGSPQRDRNKMVPPFCRTDSARYLQTFQAPAGTFAIKLRSFGGKLPRHALRKVFWQQPTPVTSIMDRAYVHRNKPASSNALSDNSRSGRM